MADDNVDPPPLFESVNIRSHDRDDDLFVSARQVCDECVYVMDVYIMDLITIL